MKIILILSAILFFLLFAAAGEVPYSGGVNNNELKVDLTHKQ